MESTSQRLTTPHTEQGLSGHFLDRGQVTTLDVPAIGNSPHLGEGREPGSLVTQSHLAKSAECPASSLPNKRWEYKRRVPFELLPFIKADL